MILFLGDSHTVFCFGNRSNRVYYILDITLNRIRKGNSDVLISYEGYDKGDSTYKYKISDNGKSLVKMINRSKADHILLSIGEIDIRWHHQKLKDDSIFENTLSFYEKLLEKIEKKIIIMFIPPVGIEHGRDHNIEDRVILTNKMNTYYKDLCNRKGYIFFDMFDDFKSEENEMLEGSKADAVHIQKRFQPYLLDNLQKIIQ